MRHTVVVSEEDRKSLAYQRTSGTLAAQAVLEASGGYVVALDGKPLRYGKTGLLNPHFVASALPQSLMRAAR